MDCPTWSLAGKKVYCSEQNQNFDFLMCHFLKLSKNSFKKIYMQKLKQSVIEFRKRNIVPSEIKTLFETVQIICLYKCSVYTKIV